MSTLLRTSISDVLQIIADLKGESTVNTDAIRIRAVSNAEKDFAGRTRWHTHLLRNQELTADGTADLELGETGYLVREKGLTEIFVGANTEDYRHNIIDFNNYKKTVYNNASEKVAYQYYDAANDKWMVHINPIPTSGVTVYYSYYWLPATKTTTTEYVYCPKPKIIALLALADLYTGEEEDEKVIDVKNEAEQLIAELLASEDSTHINQLQKFEAIENLNSSRGIGSY